jgi:hypothetical protein
LDTTPFEHRYSETVEEAAPTAVLVVPIACIECGRPWTAGGERWRMKVLFEDAPPEAVPYCPDCHEREFERD